MHKEEAEAAMLSVTINGQSQQFREGLTILEAARGAGVRIPTLCQDDRLPPGGSCRLCLVEIQGEARPVPACATTLTEGMRILTHTLALEDGRRSILQMLAARTPPDTRETEFGSWLRQYGLRATGSPDPALVDDSHPYIHVDLSKCIDCFRCVRICAELQGQFVWQVWNRGSDTSVFPGSLLGSSACVSCGACVDTCPSGALLDRTLLEQPEPTAWTRTTCPYCGTGCEMNVGTADNHITAVKPINDAPVSKGHLCVKGRYAFDFVHADDRVLWPMVRSNGTWVRTSWEYAIRYAANGLKQILREHGPDAIGMLGSARATNEDNYLTQKFARAVLGTNNVDCCARVCHGPTAAAMKTMLGTGAATNSFDDIEQARTILVCGSNATENHPIVGARIRQAALHGANLIVIDPRLTELASQATVHLRLRPGTNIPLLNSMAAVIVEEQLTDDRYIRDHIAGWDEYRAFILHSLPESTEYITAVPADLVRQAARLYAQHGPSMCFHGLGVTEHEQGTEGVMCLVNLALLTGSFGKAGCGVNPLRGQNNVQGSAHMGCEPNHLTGYVPLGANAARFAQTWHSPLPRQQGRNLMEMIDAAGAGQLRALWAIGYDILLTNANAPATRDALKRLDMVIIQDMFLNETAREFGTVFFPCCSSFEKDGTFMNAERRVQRVRKAMEPLGESRADWQILCDMAAAMGKSELFPFPTAEAIWNEIRTVWTAGAGITYQRLEHGGLQWPCPTEDHPGTKILHTHEFSLGPRAELQRIDYRASSETTSGDYPFILMTGRTLFQFNAGTMTMRTRNRELRPTDVLEIAASDASQLRLREGHKARITSRYGTCVLPVHIGVNVMPSQLFATFHSRDVFLNEVTGPHRDNTTDAPDYKVTAVRVEPVYTSLR